MHKFSKRIAGEFAALGVEVLGVELRKGAHLQLRCQFDGHSFLYSTSWNDNDFTHNVRNRTADVRRIIRAIREGNQEILRKFGVRKV